MIVFESGDGGSLVFGRGIELRRLSCEKSDFGFVRWCHEMRIWCER